MKRFLRIIAVILFVTLWVNVCIIDQEIPTLQEAQAIIEEAKATKEEAQAILEEAKAILEKVKATQAEDQATLEEAKATLEEAKATQEDQATREYAFICPLEGMDAILYGETYPNEEVYVMIQNSKKVLIHNAPSTPLSSGEKSLEDFPPEWQEALYFLWEGWDF